MNNRSYFMVGALVWMIFSVTGCGSSSKVAAVVNGQVLTVKDVEDRFSRLNPSLRAIYENDRRRFVEELVTETVLLQEAKRQGLTRDPEVQRLLKEAQRQVLMGRLLEVLRQGQPVQVTDQEIDQYYEANRKLFQEPETLRASHILVNTEEQAKKALERVKGGEPFAQVAQELSTDPSKTQGGDIGSFAKGQLIPEFEKACEDLKQGQMSGAVKSPLGFHVILLTERRAPREKPLSEVRDQIGRFMTNQHQQRQVESIVKEIRAKAQILIREPSGSSPAVSPPQTPGSPQTPPGSN